MPVIEESIVIACPPEPVFDFLSDAEKVTLWDSSVVEAAQIGTEPLTTGTRWHGVNKIMGKQLAWTTEVVDSVRPARLESKSVDGSLTFTVLYELQPHRLGTLLRYRMDAQSGLGGVFGRLGEPLVQSFQGRTVRANLKRLAELLTA